MKGNVPRLIASLLVLLFFYAAITKISNPKIFENELLNQTFPNTWVPVLMWLIPISELLVVGLILHPSKRIYGFYGSAVLMLIFTAYIGLVLLNVFDRLPCSCGGVLKHMSFEVHFFFNLFFLLLSFVAIRFSKS